MHAKACILNTREEEEVLTDVELNGIMMPLQWLRRVIMNCAKCSRVSRMFGAKDKTDKWFDRQLARSHRERRDSAPVHQDPVLVSLSTGLPFHGKDQNGPFWTFPAV